MKTVFDIRTGKETKIPLKASMEELRNDIGDKLFNQLNWEQKVFIAENSGIITYSETLFDKILIKLGIRKHFADRIIKNIKEVE